MKKKTEVKEAEVLDAVLDEFGKFEYMLFNHWKKLIGVCILIVVAVSIFFVVKEVQDSSAQAEATALSEAKTEEELVKVLAEDGASAMAREAHLRLARIYIDKKEFAKASEQFALVVKSNPPAEMLNRLSLDEAYLFENANELAKAAERFSSISKNSVLNSGMRAEAAFGAGRVYLLLKDKANATISFSLANDLTANVDETSKIWCNMAQEQLNNLKK